MHLVIQQKLAYNVHILHLPIVLKKLLYIFIVSYGELLNIYSGMTCIIYSKHLLFVNHNIVCMGQNKIIIE